MGIFNRGNKKNSRTNGFRVSSTLPSAIEMAFAMIGRSNAGKTALIHALESKTMRAKLPSGLSLALNDPIAFTRQLAENRLTDTQLNTGPLMSTMHQKEKVFHVSEGARQRICCKFNEVIGQVLTRPEEDPEEYENYQKLLSVADVLWVMVPAPPAEQTPVQMRQYEDDIELAKIYLSHALQYRSVDRPCSVGILLTKIDGCFESEEEAVADLDPADMLEELQTLADVARYADEVSYSAVFPVSGLGFGTTEVVEPTEEHGGMRTDEFTKHDVIYKLRDGEVISPFNVTPLVIWSLLCGIIHQKIDPATNESFMAMWSALRNDFDSFGPVIAEIKPLHPAPVA